MKRTNLVRTLLVVGGILLVNGSAPVAQRARPDFSGQWALSTMGFNMDLTIAQDTSTFTVTEGGLRTVSYKLDGSNSQHSTTTVAGQTWTHVSRTLWVTTALVVFTTTTIPTTGQSWDSLATYSFERSGNLIVTTLGAGKVAPFMSTTTQVYSRKQ